MAMWLRFLFAVQKEEGPTFNPPRLGEARMTEAHAARPWLEKPAGGICLELRGIYGFLGLSLREGHKTGTLKKSDKPILPVTL